MEFTEPNTKPLTLRLNAQNIALCLSMIVHTIRILHVFFILAPIPAASNLNYSNIFKRNWWDPDNQKLNDCPVCHWEHRTRFMTAGIQEESTLVIPQLSNKPIYLNIISFFFRFYMSHIICLVISGIFLGWIQDYRS